MSFSPKNNQPEKEKVDKSKIPYRNGPLSLKEQAFIKQNSASMTAEQIANHINRRATVVRRYLAEQDSSVSFANSTLNELRRSDEYQQLKEELTEREIKIFEQKFAHWVGQFQGDILFSEKNQIFNTIKQEILMSKTMQQRKNVEDALAQLDEEIKAIRDVGAFEKEDKARLEMLRDKRKDYHGVYSALMRVYQEQNSLYIQMCRELKASRKDRRTKDENQKNTLLALLKAMQNDKSKLLLGEEAELERLSAEAEGNKYKTPIQYLDGEVGVAFMSGNG